MNPYTARLVFYDGPVAVFLDDTNPSALLESYDRIRSLVVVAQAQLIEEANLCSVAQMGHAQPVSCLSGKLPANKKNSWDSPSSEPPDKN